jgi:F-type H+-transporting ATPase subunit gamma
MPNTKELRRRIRSVKNMSQITKAMQMVAATKMRRAQNQATSGRPYTTTLHKAVMALLPKLGGKITHPLITPNDSSKAAALVITTDKGLCGSLNTNIFKAVSNFINDRHEIATSPSRAPRNDVGGRKEDKVFYTIGKKGRNFVAKMGQELIADFENSDLVTFRTASQIGKLVTKDYLSENIGSFSIIYPDFVSALRQEPRIMPLLPINLEAMQAFYDMALSEKRDTKHEIRKNTDSSTGAQNDKEEFLFEPNLSELLDFVVTHYVSVKIYQALLETKASEHSARMMAMQTATDNAKELVTDLTLSYNQTRQAGITNELLEITSALAALE